jgi:iron complex outermembrane receptor protein
MEFPLDIDLIDRVEVIRGPGSSIYGSNAFLGTVNIITKRGKDYRGLDFQMRQGVLIHTKTG